MSELAFRRDPELVAFHEAAHAVVAVRSGLPFDSVTIQPAEGVGGQVINLRSNAIIHQDERVAVALAGVLAERLLRGRWPNGSLVSADEDLRRVLTIARSLPKIDAYLRWHINAAGTLVATQWAAINAVAAALLTRVELPHPEVVSVVRETPHGPTRWNPRCAQKVIDFIGFWTAPQLGLGIDPWRAA